MDELQNPINELLLIKEKIIKTDEVLKLLGDKSKNLHRVEKKYKKLLIKYSEKNREIEQLKLEYKDVQVRLNQCISIHSPLENNLSELKVRHASLEKTHNDYVNTAYNKYQSACQEVESLTKTCDTLKKKIEQLEKKEPKSAQNLRKLKGDLDKANEKLNESANKYEGIITNNNKIIEEFKAKCKTLEEQRNNDLKQLVELQQECDRLKKLLDNNNHLKGAKLDLQKQIENLERELKNSTNELEILKIAHENNIVELTKKYEKEKQLLNDKLAAFTQKAESEKLEKKKSVASVCIQTDHDDLYNVEDIFTEMITVPELMEPLNPASVVKQNDEESVDIPFLNKFNSIAVGLDIVIPEFKDSGTQTCNIEQVSTRIQEVDEPVIETISVSENNISTELPTVEELVSTKTEPAKEKHLTNFVRLKEYSQSGAFKIKHYCGDVSEDEVPKKKLKPKNKNKITKKYKNNFNKILKMVQKTKLNTKKILDKILAVNNPVIVLSPSILNSYANGTNISSPLSRLPTNHAGHPYCNNNGSLPTCSNMYSSYNNCHPSCPYNYRPSELDCSNGLLHSVNKNEAKDKISDSENENYVENLRQTKHRRRDLQVKKNIRRSNNGQFAEQKKKLREKNTSTTSSNYASSWKDILELKKERLSESNVFSEYQYSMEEMEDRVRKRYSRRRRIIYSTDEEESPDKNVEETKSSNQSVKSVNSCSVSEKTDASVLLNKYLDSIPVHVHLENNAKSTKSTKSSDSDSGIETFSIKNIQSPSSSQELTEAEAYVTKPVVDELVTQKSDTKKRNKSLDDSGINIGTLKSCRKVKRKSNENSLLVAERETSTVNEKVVETPIKNKPFETEKSIEKEMHASKVNSFGKETPITKEKSIDKENTAAKKRKRNSVNISEYKRQSLEIFGSETDTDSEPLINLLSPKKRVSYKTTRMNLRKKIIVASRYTPVMARKSVETSSNQISASSAKVNNDSEVLTNPISPKKRIAHSRRSSLKSVDELVKPASVEDSTESRMKLIEKLVKNQKNVMNNTAQVTNYSLEKSVSVYKKPEKLKAISSNQNAKAIPSPLSVNTSVCSANNNSSKPVQTSCEANNSNAALKTPVKTNTPPPCPMSPEFMEHVHEEPKIIPLEKPKPLNIKIGRKLVSDIAKLDWNKELMATVVNCLSKEDPQYVARLIVNEAAKDFSQEFDKTFTPPAPLLTVTQQKLLVLLNRLQKNNLVGIEECFLRLVEQRLYKEKKVEVVHPLTRLYVAVCKLKFDIEQVRLFCCNAAYYMGDLFVPLLFIVLTMWGDVIPMAADSEDIFLANVLVYVTQLKKCNQPGYNNNNLKCLLTKFYGYEVGRTTHDEIMTKLVKVYSESCSKLAYTAILILCKNLPSKWTCSQIKKHLMPLIETRLTNKNDSDLISMAITLINRLMETFDENVDKEHLIEVKSWMIKVLRDNSTLSSAENTIVKYEVNL